MIFSIFHQRTALRSHCTVLVKNQHGVRLSSNNSNMAMFLPNQSLLVDTQENRNPHICKVFVPKLMALSCQFCKGPQMNQMGSSLDKSSLGLICWERKEGGKENLHLNYKAIPLKDFIISIWYSSKAVTVR